MTIAGANTSDAHEFLRIDMEHHAPHPNATFEGYYSKFDLFSGGHVVIVICRIKNAKIRPNMISFTYVPKEGPPSNIYQKEIWLDRIDMTASSENNEFHLELPGLGYARWYANSTTEYYFEHSSFFFQAKVTSVTPWSLHTNTPEGVLVRLPLPLHWHVYSLASDCHFHLKIPALELAGSATVHEEKNWAKSFPSAHMWLQARNGTKGFCCAGGQILGIEAFLLGYRSDDLNIDFRPPFAAQFAGLSPFMTYNTDWERRCFELSVQSFKYRVTIHAKAPKGSFFTLSSPFPEGHRENYLCQSFQARFEIKIYEGNWLGPWNLIREDSFNNASLEFGGAYYPPAGSKERYH